MTDKDTIRNLEEKIRRLQQESKQAIEIVKRLKEWKTTDEGKDIRLLDKAGYPKLQSIINGESKDG